MAKPAKIKKVPSAEQPAKKKSDRKAARPAAGGGLKGRMAKAQAAKGGKGAAKTGRSPARFLREVRSEMSKVTWPSRNELVQSTIVVLVAVVIAGIFIFLFDSLFVYLVEQATNLFGGE